MQKMTLEELRAEMVRRGCNAGSARSSGVAYALDILTEANGVLIDIDEAERKLETKQRKFAEQSASKDALYGRYRKQIDEAHDEWEKMQKYVDDFRQSLLDAETPEARDRLRTAQMFVNSVDVDTKYDNTAFIIGLAEILAGRSAAIDALKKVNPRLTDPSRMRL